MRPHVGEHCVKDTKEEEEYNSNTMTTVPYTFWSYPAGLTIADPPAISHLLVKTPHTTA